MRPNYIKRFAAFGAKPERSVCLTQARLRMMLQSTDKNRAPELEIVSREVRMSMAFLLMRSHRRTVCAALGTGWGWFAVACLVFGPILGLVCLPIRLTGRGVAIALGVPPPA